MPSDMILLEPGETVPDGLSVETRVFVSFDDGALPVGTALEGGGIVAPPLSDGCLGRHWPDSQTCDLHQGA